MKRPERSKSESSAMRLTALGVIGLALWVGVLGGAVYGLREADRISAEKAAELPLSVDWGTSVPEWIKTESWHYILDDIHANLAPQVTDGIRSPGLAERIAYTVTLSPWVRTVRRVSVQSDGVLRIDAEFRKPIAVVVSDSRAYPIAEDGVRLSLRGYQLSAQEAASAGYFLIVGVPALPPLEGKAWGGAEVYNALKLVNYFERFDWSKPTMPELRAKINIIDAAPHRETCVDRCLRLRTAEGGLIEWGLPPGDESGVEASAADKFARLRGLAQSGIPTDKLVDLREFNTVTFKSFAPPPAAPTTPPTTPPAGGRRR